MSDADAGVKARVLELLATRPADELSITEIVNALRGDDEVAPDDPELFGEARAAVKELRAENKITGRVDGGQCFYAAAVDKPGTRQPNSAITAPKKAAPAPKKPETIMKEKPRSRRSVKLETARDHILATLERHDTMQDIAAMTAKGISKAVTFKALSELKAEERIFGIKGGPKVGSRYGLKGKTYEAANAFGKPNRIPREAPEPKPAKPKINGHAIRKAPPDVGVKADLGARFGFWSDHSLQIEASGCKGVLTPAEFDQLLDLIDNSRARTAA